MMDIDKQCAEALARITKHINAAAGQHKRAIGRAHQKAMYDLVKPVRTNGIWEGLRRGEEVSNLGMAYMRKYNAKMLAIESDCVRGAA